jgi:hypothetical protein
MDARVDGNNFDAVTDNSLLWEVKTHDLAKSKPFIQSMIVLQTNAQLEEYGKSAPKCGYLMAFGVGDPKLAALVRPDLYDTLAIRPDICLQP